MLKIEFQGDGILRFTELVDTLGSKQAERAYAIALNRTGQKVFTRVRRVVAKQAGVSQRDAVRYGQLQQVKAGGGRLEHRVKASGRSLPTTIFKSRQTRKGVSAAPWGRRLTFPGTFKVASLGGHVFKRTGAANSGSGRNNAIARHWGPAIPRELVRDASAEAFYEVAGKEMPVELSRAVYVLTKRKMK